MINWSHSAHICIEMIYEHDSLSQYILIHNPCCPQDSKILCKQACDDDIHMFVTYCFILLLQDLQVGMQTIPTGSIMHHIESYPICNILSPISTILPWYTVVAWTNNDSHLFPSYPCYILVQWLVRIILLLVNIDYTPVISPWKGYYLHDIPGFFLIFLALSHPSTKTASACQNHQQGSDTRDLVAQQGWLSTVVHGHLKLSWLVVDLPLWKIVKWEYDSQHMENKSHVPNHQPVSIQSPLVIFHIAIENGHRNSSYFPNTKWWFSSSQTVSLPEGIQSPLNPYWGWASSVPRRKSSQDLWDRSIVIHKVIHCHHGHRKVHSDALIHFFCFFFLRISVDEIMLNPSNSSIFPPFVLVKSC